MAHGHTCFKALDAGMKPDKPSLFQLVGLGFRVFGN